MEFPRGNSLGVVVYGSQQDKKVFFKLMDLAIWYNYVERGVYNGYAGSHPSYSTMGDKYASVITMHQPIGGRTYRIHFRATEDATWGSLGSTDRIPNYGICFVTQGKNSKSIANAKRKIKNLIATNRQKNRVKLLRIPYFIVVINDDDDD